MQRTCAGRGFDASTFEQPDPVAVGMVALSMAVRGMNAPFVNPEKFRAEAVPEVQRIDFRRPQRRRRHRVERVLLKMDN
jgi:hypothetical protein